MDDLSIHELVGSFPIVSRFFDSAEKTFSPGGTSSAGRNRYTNYFGWIFQPYGRVSRATFAIDLLLRPYFGTIRSRTLRAIFQ